MDRALELLKDGALRIPEVTRTYGIGRSTLYEAMKKGELAYLKIGNARRIPRRAVEEWLAKHLVIGGQRGGA